MKRKIYSLRAGADDPGHEDIPTWCFSMFVVQPYHCVEMLEAVLRREVRYSPEDKKLRWNAKRNKACSVTVDTAVWEEPA